MQKNKLNLKEIENNIQESKVHEYMNKYIKELQRHFDLSDKRMRVILYRIYQETGPVNFIKTLIKTKISMLKSKYISYLMKLRGNKDDFE